MTRKRKCIECGEPYTRIKDFGVFYAGDKQLCSGRCFSEWFRKSDTPCSCKHRYDIHHVGGCDFCDCQGYGIGEAA
jgi:hypothetical protein